MPFFFMLVAAFLGGRTSGDTPTTSVGSAQPVCVQSHVFLPTEDGSPSTLAWQEPGAKGGRRVTVVFNEVGEPLQYSEIETSDPIETFDRTGQYRLVFVNFESETAIVEIQNVDGERLNEAREIGAVLHSVELGNPFATIRLVRSECTSF